MPNELRRRYIKPRDPNAEPVCTLTAEAARQRKEPPNALLDEALSQQTGEEGTEFRFEAKAGLWDRIGTFIEEEGDCCPFFAFDLREEGDEIVLRIIRPSEVAG